MRHQNGEAAVRRGKPGDALGVNLGEIWHLSELADWLRAHKRYRFLLTAPPLRLPGAVGSPATPVGTV